MDWPTVNKTECRNPFEPSERHICTEYSWYSFLHNINFAHSEIPVNFKRLFCYLKYSQIEIWAGVPVFPTGAAEGQSLEPHGHDWFVIPYRPQHCWWMWFWKGWSSAAQPGGSLLGIYPSLFFIVSGNSNCRSVHHLAFDLGKPRVTARLRNHPLCCLCLGSCMELIGVLSTFLCVIHPLFYILLLSILLLLLFVPYPIDRYQ